MRTEGVRCVALTGSIGGCVACTIYDRRPTVCRSCEAGSQSCLIARRHHGLPVPPTTSGMDELIPG